MSNIMSNRNSTPEASHVSSLRPPSARTPGTGHGLRTSADIAALNDQTSTRPIRPSSDFYGSQTTGLGSQGNNNADHDLQEKLAQQWIADIDQSENTLEEMAAATLDQDFKDELSAIEQWFRVLSEAERTAALYALLQQTTQVQVRFFIQVLQQMGKNHPMSGVLSPANFDKDPMSTRLTDAMNKLNVDSARSSANRTTANTGAKRHSGLDSSTINAMFPDAAAAIATEKAKFTQQTGALPTSKRDSALAVPTISAPNEDGGALPSSPWGATTDANRPKSSSGQAPMGQFVQPPPSAGLRSPLPAQLAPTGSQIQTTTLTAGDKTDMPLISPFNGASGNWASMVNTPMMPNFNQQGQPGSQADMVANATAMKLAALSTVNNRFALDDVRKYRRARSYDTPGNPQNQMSPNAAPSQAANAGVPPGANFVMINEHGQVLGRDQMMAIQNQQAAMACAGYGSHRSRPTSPGVVMQPGFAPAAMPFTSPQNNRFLSAYDGSSPMLNGGGLMPLNMSQLGLAPYEGYLSDHSEMAARGRSPRGRRGISKPPEDPTDPTLLQDIPSWLRSLRLHKYTENLKDMKWQELIELDDKQLEERGVNALGARRKMLKVFEQVKEAKAEGKLS